MGRISREAEESVAVAQQPFRVVEICAGAGGQSLGLEHAGFGHELAVELDGNAAATLMHNRTSWAVAQGDVASAEVWTPADYAGIDLFAGGVPCPPFSIAGRQLGAVDERDLFAWAVEQVSVMRPRALLLENVRGLSTPRFAGYRQHVLDRLAELGYVAEWTVLNASDFGLAQLRPRFVLVALRPEDARYFRWPAPVGAPPTVGEVLLPLMSSGGWQGAERWAAHADAIGPTIVGGSKKHGGADLGPTRAKRAWADLGVDGRGIADRVPDGADAVDLIPKLTLEMVARLQGWQEGEWEFIGGKTSKYRQMGNAFPPPVAEAVGNAILGALMRVGTARPEIELETQLHDPVLRLLKSANDYVSESQIAALGSQLHGREVSVEKHMARLMRDFEIDVRRKRGTSYYKLIEFKGFIGQEAHERHDAFSRNRALIS